MFSPALVPPPIRHTPLVHRPPRTPFTSVFKPFLPDARISAKAGSPLPTANTASSSPNPKPLNRCTAAIDQTPDRQVLRLGAFPRNNPSQLASIDTCKTSFLKIHQALSQKNDVCGVQILHHKQHTITVATGCGRPQKDNQSDPTHPGRDLSLAINEISGQIFVTLPKR